RAAKYSNQLGRTIHHATGTASPASEDASRDRAPIATDMSATEDLGFHQVEFLAGWQAFWIDTATAHLSTGGWRIKTVPARLSAVDLARLRHAGARPRARPPAHPPARWPPAAAWKSAGWSMPAAGSRWAIS